MAREQEEAPRSHRLVAVGAVALLLAAAAVAFGRVFSGHMPTLKLLATAMGSLAIAASLERRNPVLAALVSAAGLLLFLGWLVFPQTLWYGLPSGRTFHAISQALSEVGEQTRVQVAPTEPLRPLLMAAVTAMWTAAFSTHALALRSGSPLLAAVPCAALLAFAGIVVGDGARRGYAALFLFGLLAVLFVDGLRRVRQWGPLRPWQGTSRPRFTSTTTTRGARRVAFAAVIVALLIPGILPGFRSAPLLATIGNGSPGPRVNPLVSVTASLKRGKAIDLFTVQASHGAYWRWMGLDTFDGTTWTTDDLHLESGTFITSGNQLPDPEPPGMTTTSPSVERVAQAVHVINSPGEWLPMAYAPVTVSLLGGGVTYDPNMAAGRPSPEMASGLDYSVTSLVPKPSFDQLDRNFDFGTPSRYTQLPADTRREILPLVQTVLDSAGDPRDPIRKVLAIQNYFANSGIFTYDTNVSGRHDTKFLVHFLKVSHRGFCQQFATAMAVMLRAIGIPSRTAVGFTQGKFDPKTKTYLVTTADAHSWVEVLFPGYGWIPFEPTPSGFSNPVTGHILRGARDTIGGNAIGPEETNVGRGSRGNRPDPHQRDADSGTFGGRKVLDPGRGAGVIPSPPRSYTGLILLTLAVLIGAAAVGIPAWKMSWRRRELRRAHTPRAVALAAYRVFASRAADVGFGRTPDETMAEYHARLTRDLPSPNGDLDRLTRIAGVAAYSPHDPTGRDATSALSSGRAAIASVRRDVPLIRRVVGTFRLRISG
jgi:transglutaminase TgpA-like protein/transglutaminase superfamily protein/uncharacterized protein DUF4129